MPQPLIITLLLFVFVLPILGAVVLRLLMPRLTPVQLYSAAVLLLGIVIASVLVLARSDIPSLQVGNLSILLPITAPDSSTPRRVPTTPVDQSPAPLATSAPVTATVRPLDTATTIPPTAAATQTATAAPTAEPTAAPTTTPEPTAVPPTAIPPTAVPPAAPRTYTVQPGDTLLSIAEEFNTTVTAIVEANNLTPQQADALRVGQELVIP